MQQTPADAFDLGFGPERSLTSLLVWLLENRFEMLDGTLELHLGAIGFGALQVYAPVLEAVA